MVWCAPIECRQLDGSAAGKGFSRRATRNVKPRGSRGFSLNDGPSDAWAGRAARAQALRAHRGFGFHGALRGKPLPALALLRHRRSSGLDPGKAILGIFVAGSFPDCPGLSARHPDPPARSIGHFVLSGSMRRLRPGLCGHPIAPLRLCPRRQLRVDQRGRGRRSSCRLRQSRRLRARLSGNMLAETVHRPLPHTRSPGKPAPISQGSSHVFLFHP